MLRRMVAWTLLMAPLTLLAGGETRGQYYSTLGQSYSDLLGVVSPGLADGTVTGTGIVVLKRQPTVMRMHVELLGRGKTLDEALANLKDRREAAIAQLEAMKADKASIQVGPPSLSTASSAQRRQFEQMVRQLTARGQTVPAGLKVPKSFTISSTLKAEWPLPAGTPEQLLSTVVAIQEKVTAADLAGVKDAPALSPEEQELEDEMAAMMRNYGEESIPAGTPVFLFVARVSDEDRQQATAEAFKKAKASAEQLALAAGQPLGPLVALAGRRGGGAGYDELSSGLYSDYSRQQYLMQLIGSAPDLVASASSGESIGGDGTPLLFLFVVQANFRLAEPKQP